jgi:hypothetical protein
VLWFAKYYTSSWGLRISPQVVQHNRGEILRPPGDSDTQLIVFRYKEIMGALNIEEKVLFLSKVYLDKNVILLVCDFITRTVVYNPKMMT